jgi:hypothetical protein
MWEPVGPLPAAVYWRRRCVALASAVTLVGFVLATAGAPVGTPVPAANRASTSGSAATTPRPAGGPTTGASTPTARDRSVTEGARDVDPETSDSPRPDRTTAAPVPDTSTPTGRPSSAPTDPPSSSAPPGSALPGPFSAASEPSASAPGTTTERIRPDDTPRPSVAAQPSVPVPPSGPVPCTNEMLSATAELDQPVHRVGSHPVLRLVVANVSGQPCVRDLDSARQEIVVWSEDGSARLWSSNDCVNASTIDLRTLVPGRPVAFAVTWGERTTTPGCRTPRTVVPAGSYRLMVRLDDLISPPTPFIRTP